MYEQMGSREITFTKTGMTGKRIFVHEWEDWKHYIRIVAPMDSDFPGEPGLKVCSVHATPYGQTKTGVQGDEYTFAKIDVDYQTTPYNNETEGICEPVHRFGPARRAGIAGLR